MSSVSQFNLERGQETLHPLVTVLDQSKSKRIYSHQFISKLYIIFLKDTMCGELSYGRNHYDYQDQTLLFVAPDQLLRLPETSGWIQPQGWVLAFHPDLIRGTFFSKSIHEYNFLHMIPTRPYMYRHVNDKLLSSASKRLYPNLKTL